MMSLIALYLSLIMQLVAAGFAISLVKKTKYNAAWILISGGLIIMVAVRIMEFDGEFKVAERWMNFFASLVFLIGIFYVNKLIKYLKRIEEFRQKMENRVLSAVIRTEERERQNFAKELHDGLGPLLSVIKMLVSADSSSVTDGEKAKIRENVRQAVDEAITSVREISANISPHILNDFGLYAAIEAFVKRIKRNMDVTFESDICGMRFPYAVENIMYRVVCELINNTIKHANATRITIRVSREDSRLLLEYSDNGKGFEVEEETIGMGLENMRYRLRSGNGNLDLHSSPGKGMSAVASISCDLF